MARDLLRAALVCGCLATVLCAGDEVDRSSTNVVKDLLTAQQRAKDGVIHLNSVTFSKYITGKQRPFAVYMFLTANHLADKPGLNLGSMRKEFGYLAKTYKDKIAKGEVETPGSVFFADAEFKEAQELFQRLGVNSLPYVFMLPGSTSVDRERIKLKDSEVLKPDSYENFPWTTDEFDSFLRDKIGVSVGKVEKPSLMTSPFFPFLALAFLAVSGTAGYQLYYAPFMKNLLIWSTGAIAVYWFSVSGGMHNIIRGIPLYVLTHEGAQFFMPPGQGQLGAEGFMCGTGYLLVGLSVTGVTFMNKLVPRLDPQKQRYLAFGIMAIGAWSLMKVVGTYRWKTGYRWRTYFGGWRG